jgi:hypothetical protein
MDACPHARSETLCSRPLFWLWLLQEYVNYRQSCLTRLLKECLGGNSHSCMFANIAQGNYLVCAAGCGLSPRSPRRDQGLMRGDCIRQCRTRCRP